MMERGTEILHKDLQEIKGAILALPHWKYITYPKQGGEGTIYKGVTSIDFLEGKIRHANGTVEDLSFSLKTAGEKFVRSFYIESTEAILWRLDDGGWFVCDANDYVLGTYQNYREMQINLTTANTAYIRVYACTNPEAVISRGMATTYGITRTMTTYKAHTASNTATNYTTTHTKKWRLSNIMIHFSGAANSTISVYIVDTEDSNYTTKIASGTVAGGQDCFIYFADGEIDFDVGKEVNVQCTAPGVGVDTYITIITEDL